MAYHAFTPQNYDSNKTYPLIIHFSTYELTNYSQYYKNYLTEDVISVDISQRGFTMGSYVGEAAILETLDDILNKFSIDKSRIYLLGHSNGLSELTIDASSKTIDTYITALQELGFDIIRNRSTQYQYFFASRNFSMFELKLIIDAVQAAHFIPKSQTEELVRRIAELANKNQSEDLRRNLFVSKLKDNDKNTLTMADWLNTAINQNKKVSFQYYEYDREGKKVLKYEGYRYKFSPYALVWNMDSYFVIGCYERKEKPTIIKFRIDKICSIQIEDEDRIPCPTDFNLSEYIEPMFLMHGAQKQDVTMRCAYSVIDKVIDRFGEDIKITPVSDDEFEITEAVAVGSTFYSWKLNYGGRIKIVAPDEVKQGFNDLIHKFDLK